MGVLLCSALLLGLLRKLIPSEALLPAAVLTVAGFASMAQLLLQALLPSLFEMLGFYLAILAVALLLFGSGEDAADFGAGQGPAERPGKRLLLCGVRAAAGRYPGALRRGQPCRQRRSSA